MGEACGMYGGRKVHTKFWWGDLMEIPHLEDLGVDGRIILNWIFKKWNGEAWIGCSGSGYGKMEDACECGNEPLGSTKCAECLD